MERMLQELREKYPQYIIGGIFAGERDKVGVHLCCDWPKDEVCKIFELIILKLRPQ